MDVYGKPVGLTSQFRFCPNAFRVDMYKGCDFGCSYCFANITNAHGHQGLASASIKDLKHLFFTAFCTNAKDNLTLELLRQRVPLHCGGKSDPFQKREWKEHLTYELIKLSNKYNYPICFSTKTRSLLEEYYEILNPELHAFQVSILGWSDDFVKTWEHNTPTALDRLAFVKLLRSRGFWCSIRIQPLIDIEEAECLVMNAGSIPSYITVEHLKLPADNNDMLFRIMKKNNLDYSAYKKSPYAMRNLEVPKELKIQNIDRIKKIANSYGVKVGVGDNDLHHLSQSRCCCGIDTINDNFSNYLKYNLTYFITGDVEDVENLYCPESSINECFYSGDTNMGKSYKQVVDDYINKFSGLVPQDKVSVLKKLKIYKNKLF